MADFRFSSLVVGSQSRQPSQRGPQKAIRPFQFGFNLFGILKQAMHISSKMEILEHRKEKNNRQGRNPMKFGRNYYEWWNSNQLKIQDFMRRFKFGTPMRG
ncbi:hypothetical protein AVEN_43644-1 [Araneus ventricosus]|uniref:Uncharacterized protein n=1 Tax=Araneus ventricosus TaxID=182803 RepID=A0A4Y2FCK1_ARAVE|nr:hypothetical protein AVEN_43644-1 [Araneus ventricosus]